MNAKQPNKMIKIYITLFIYFLLNSYSFAYEFKEKEIHFLIKHPLHNVKGICKNIIISDLEIIEKEEALISQKPFYIKIPLISLTTNNRNRDSNMLYILGYPNYKDIDIVITQVDLRDLNKLKFYGKITIKNKTKEFVSEGTLKKSNHTYIIEGKTTLLFSDFDLERPSLLGLSVENEISIDYFFSIIP